MNLPSVSDIMTRDPITVRPSQTLRAAIEAMREHHCRRLPVMDDGKLVGIISDRDVRLALNSPFIMRDRREDRVLLDQVLVAECMTPGPVTLMPEQSVLEAARLMHDRKFGGLPVVEKGRLVGIVTETDVLRCFIDLHSN